jgi:phosphatidylserine decarboxylase
VSVEIVTQPRSTGRLADAWSNTPTRWYPLPVGIGAVLLGVIQFRKRQQAIDGKEVVADEHGTEVIKLKGPWQVRLSYSHPLNYS